MGSSILNTFLRLKSPNIGRFVRILLLWTVNLACFRSGCRTRMKEMMVYVYIVVLMESEHVKLVSKIKFVRKSVAYSIIVPCYNLPLSAYCPCCFRYCRSYLFQQNVATYISHVIQIDIIRTLS